MGDFPCANKFMIILDEAKFYMTWKVQYAFANSRTVLNAFLVVAPVTYK